MPRVLAAAALAGALVFAACGSADDNASEAAAPVKTVSIKHVDGVGDVLVDATGHALYTSDQEARGKIRCTDECLSFWLPLEGGSQPTAADGAGSLATVRRPDGTHQVTVDAKPVYTFSEDAPGKVTGDGFKDEFGGQKFTWHVVLADGGKSDASSSGGGGYTY
jgi:predicted lipoprotein with Yx(FWY)xxD motif